MTVPVIAISWEDHRRTVGLAGGLQIPLYVLTTSGGRLSRYLKLGWRTLRLFAKYQPKTVLVQNPSLILALLACMARPVWRHKVVIDAHNEAIEPYINTQWPIPGVARWLMRKADITIVTNTELAAVVSRCGGRPAILPDRLPDLPFDPTPAPRLSDTMHVMVIATYAPDEPISEIFEAASLLGVSYQFRVTGRDSKLLSETRSRKPSNVHLTGFLAEDKYWELMSVSHLVLDLSLMPNCLVCGAYESLALGRPMVLTESAASENLFGRVAVLARTSASDIARALGEARTRYAELSGGMASARVEFADRWNRAAQNLKQQF